MSDASDTWWGVAIGAVIVGGPLVFFAGPISRWNRRVSRKTGWRTPAEGTTDEFWWGEKYLRIVGAVSLVIGLVAVGVALSR